MNMLCWMLAENDTTQETSCKARPQADKIGGTDVDRECSASSGTFEVRPCQHSSHADRLLLKCVRLSNKQSVRAAKKTEPKSRTHVAYWF